MKKNNKIKFLEMVSQTHDKGLLNIVKELNKLKANVLTIEDAKKRDYIVRTKYVGKIKDDKLLKDFKHEISDTIGDCFESICSEILNFRLVNLSKFKDILKNYEMKQIVIDTYATKK